MYFIPKRAPKLGANYGFFKGFDDFFLIIWPVLIPQQTKHYSVLDIWHRVIYSFHKCTGFSTKKYVLLPKSAEIKTSLFFSWMIRCMRKQSNEWFWFMKPQMLSKGNELFYFLYTILWVVSLVECSDFWLYCFSICMKIVRTSTFQVVRDMLRLLECAKPTWKMLHT